MVLFLNWKRSESVQSLGYSCSKCPGHQLGTRASAAPFVYGSDVIGAEPSVMRKLRPFRVPDALLASPSRAQCANSHLQVRLQRSRETEVISGHAKSAPATASNWQYCVLTGNG